MGRVFYVIIAVFLLLGCFSTLIISGINDWRTDETEQSYAVTTAAGVTTANVTLSKDLFQDDVSYVNTVTSNVTGETPVATTYTSATNVLLLSALNASETHTVTVNYDADTDDTVMGAIGPFMAFLVIGSLLVTVFMRGIKNR